VVSSAIALAALVLAAGPRLARDVAAEVGRLNGEWECVGMTEGGKPLPRGRWEGMRLTIKGRDWTLTGRGTSDFRMQPAAMDLRRTPKRLQFRDHPAMLLQLNYIPGRYRWVYALDGDTLKASHKAGDPGYPARVDGGDEGQICFEYRRVKKR
jgi:uncharacterized protein (TIGR03067 family)